jgi:hypothetical protein
VAPFASAVSAARTTTKRVIDFPQKLTAQTGSYGRNILFGSSDSKLNHIGRLDVGGQRCRRTFRRYEQFIPFLQQH